MPTLHGLLNTIALLGLAIGVLTSINTGRKLARRRHDAELAKRYGRQLPGLGLILYAYMMLAFIFNVAGIVFMQAATGGFRFIVSTLTGHLLGFIAGIALTAALVTTSYFYYMRKYQGIEEPLTREGRIALRGIQAGTKLKKSVGEKLGGALGRRKRDER